VEIYADQLERTGVTMTRLIAQHTGQPEATVRADSMRDRWFDAEQARDYGIIDHIVQRVEDVRPSGGRRMAGL
jgi:ATP-dependent Clp protease protease subunit